MSKPIVPGDTWWWRDNHVTVLSVVGTVVDVASLRTNERASTITDELLREGHYIRSAVEQCRVWHASRVELVRRVSPESQKRWHITELKEDYGCPSGWLAVASATPKDGARDVIRGCASTMTRWLMPAPKPTENDAKGLRLLSSQLDDALRTAGKAAAAAAQRVVLAASGVRPNEPTPPAPAADTCHFCGGPNEGPIPSLPCPRCFAAREAASEGLHLPAAIERAIASLPPDDELLPPLRSIHDTLRAALDIGRCGRVSREKLIEVYGRAGLALRLTAEAAVSSPRQRYEARYASRLQIAAVAASAALGAGIVAPRPAPPPKPPAATPALVVCDHGWNDDDSGIDW